MVRRLGGAYLVLGLALAVCVGRLRDLMGAPALLAGYVAFVALTVVALRGAIAGRSRTHPAFGPGVLLLAGPLVLLLGASVTGEPTAALPGDYLINTTAILLGSVVLVAGVVVLVVRLWDAGERVLPALGLAGLLVASAGWLVNLLFRYAVVASGAAGLQAAVEDRAWVADVYLLGLPGAPSWMELLLVWTDLLQLAFVTMAYLAAAAMATSAARIGWLGRRTGRSLAALGLAAASGVVAGAVLAGAGSPAAATAVFVLTIPFMAFLLPYATGVALVWRAGRPAPVPAPAGALATSAP